jgi:hypothetical protein
MVLTAKEAKDPDGTFPVSPLPYLRLTVNNYPTWTYPDTGNDEDKLLLLEHADSSAVTVLAAQVTAWREGKSYVAELAENSAGR